MRGTHRIAALSLAVAAGALVAAAVVAPAQAAMPTSVTVAGSLQSEAGCSADWQPDCAATHMTAGPDGIWRKTLAVPAGTYDYKAAIDDSWTESYGGPGGVQITLTLAAAASVTFYYDPVTHYLADNVNSVIVSAPGDFQSELGCSGDWDPSCLKSWLQDPDGDGTYTMTISPPAGTYAAKAAINESWTVSYGAGGDPAGAQIPFTVPAGTPVLFSYDSATHVLTITVGTQTTPTPPTSSSAGSTGTGTNTTTTTDAGLPVTGTSSVLPLAIGGAVILLVGAGLLVLARRRRITG
jgi:pullulanase